VWSNKGRRGRVKGSPCSITESRVPELILVLGSQPTGDVSHKPGGRLPLLSARPTVTIATIKRAANHSATEPPCGEETKEEQEGERHPPHVRSPPLQLFSCGCAYAGDHPRHQQPPLQSGHGDISSSYNKKLSYRRGTARCVVLVEILPIAAQQCRNYLYDKF